MFFFVKFTSSLSHDFSNGCLLFSSSLPPPFLSNGRLPFLRRMTIKIPTCISQCIDMCAIYQFLQILRFVDFSSLDFLNFKVPKFTNFHAPWILFSILVLGKHSIQLILNKLSSISDPSQALMSLLYFTIAHFQFP